MATKKTTHEQTTAAELSELTVPELEKLAAKRNVTVTRGDGDEGDPLHADYVRALAGTTETGARVRFQHKYVDAQGNPVNEDGDRIDRYGVVIETNE